MNIFFLSGKTRRCAKWHCDKHVVKMILEYTQILYTANHVNGGTKKIEASAPICASTGKRGYKKHAANHPSVKWATESLAHYLWLNNLALELVKEYDYRFKPSEPHACLKHLQWLRANIPLELTFSRYWMRDPPPAMPEEFQVKNNSLQSYWNYYNGSKRERGLLIYTGRHMPHVFRLVKHLTK